VRPLLLLCFAANAVALAASDLDTDNLFRGLNSRWASSWALGDLDGDRKIDLVSARPGLRDGQGYAHEVSVHFGGPFEEGSFTFHGRAARIRLSIRDIDGDQDRDIVILEARSSGVLGVWLNDGFGHFHEGDIANFRAARGDRDSAALEFPAFDRDPFTAIFEQSIDPADLTVLAFEPEPALERIDCESGSAFRNIHRADCRSRAPPVKA
jgi:hypothetical protein